MKGSQSLLNQLYTWCLSNKLTINTNKTKYMFIAHRKNQEDVVLKTTVSMNNEILHYVRTHIDT